MAKQRGIQWAAGLFEGEGTWLSRGGSAQAALGSTDRDVVEAFAAIVGFGKVRQQRGTLGGGLVTHETDEKKYKSQFVWSVSNAAEVRKLIKLLMPYLGDRRRARAEAILAATATTRRGGGSKFQTHCKYGHEYTEENTGWSTGRNPQNGKTYTTRYCKACRRAK